MFCFKKLKLILGDDVVIASYVGLVFELLFIFCNLLIAFGCS